MNQLKIGKFLKQLRTEKNLTQEQLAESLNVSRRTVSRWETGFNLPDLDILVIMSDFYQVDLRELLDGERKNGKMDEEMKETVMKVAEYSNEEKKRVSRVVLVYFILGIAALFANVIMRMMDFKESFMYGFADGATIGLALGAMILGILYALVYSVVMDRMIVLEQGGYQIMIWTEKLPEINEELLEIGFGTTLIRARGGYLRDEKEVILCAASNRNFNKVKRAVLSIDRNAFMTITSMNEVNGNGFTYMLADEDYVSELEDRHDGRELSGI